MKVGLCCIAKMENNFIHEYVEYYFNLGFDKIFLYDNNDINGEHFEDVISDYIDNDFVEVINYRGEKICQLKAYQECYNTHKDYDWLAFFDCDEFLTFNDEEQSTNIHDFLSKKIFNEFQEIHPNWMMFDDNGLLEPDGRGVLERFTHPCEGEHAINNDGVKTIIRGGLNDVMWIGNPHAPITKNRTCDAEGNELLNEYAHSHGIITNHKGAYIKHFACKTITEYCNIKVAKQSYPDQDSYLAKSHLLMDYFWRINERTEEKEKIADKLFPNASSKIIVDLYVLCFNEIKIAPYVVQYWERTYNHVYVLDNGSTDGSIEYLQQFPFVTIFKFDTNNTFNDIVHVQVKNSCWKNSKADFVVVSDFDECIYPEDFQEKLKYMQNNGMTISTVKGYEIISDEFPEIDKNHLTCETIKKCAYNRFLQKPLIFNPHKISEINYSVGAHTCNPVGEVKWNDKNIIMFHHKFLSFDYVYNRYKFFKGRLSEDNLKNGLGTHYLEEKEKIEKTFTEYKENSLDIQTVLNQKGDVVLVSHEMGLSGAPRALLNMGKVFKELGYNVTVTCVTDGKIVKEFEENGINTIVQKPLGEIIDVFMNANIIVFNTIVSSIYINILNLPLKAKKILWIHEGEVAFQVFKNLPINEFASKMDKIYTVGSYSNKITQKYIQRECGILNYYIDDKNIEKKSNDDEFIHFLIIGTVEERKGYHLIDAMLKKYYTQIHDKIRIDIIGKTNNEEIISSIKANGKEIINYLGEIPNDKVLEEISKTNCILCPSIDDPMPITVTEGLMLSKPVIITNNTGTASLIKEDINGYVCDADVDSIYSSIIKFYLHPLNEIEDNRNIYIDNFSKESFVKAIKKETI